MSPSGLDVIIYEYFNRMERQNFISTADRRESLERICRLIYMDEYSSPAQDYERAKKALEIQL